MNYLGVCSHKKLQSSLHVSVFLDLKTFLTREKEEFFLRSIDQLKKTSVVGFFKIGQFIIVFKWLQKLMNQMASLRNFRK